MIQEKDFLYRVPVKNVLVTTPRQQVRNPEILVDVEGGEFMHGNILDANSTNKLINQSVKDAVDNKLIESGYVTKDLLEAETTRATEQENSLKTLIGAETSARTKGDEDLSSKIKAEQTRAEGKEKEISDKLAIVNGDSNTEGSFRKAIADVVAAAPEDLDTLKEIADKLAGNDDLHTALNQAITEKADASALANEVTRATGAESGLQAAIATKADATALSNYVLTTALNQQVDTLNAAISAKQDAGNYIECENYENGTFTYHLYDKRKIQFEDLGDDVRHSKINGSKFYLEKYEYGADYEKETVEYSVNGITSNKHNSCLATSDGTFKPISDFVLKTELPTVPTKTSQLTNDSNFIAADHISDTYLGFAKDLKIYSENTGNITTISRTGINFETDINDVAINEDGFFVSRDSDDAQLCSFTPSGIKFAGKTDDDIPTANGTFTSITEKVDTIVDDYNFVTNQEADFKYARADTVDSLNDNVNAMNSKLSQTLDKISNKQDAITVNSVDVTGVETADIEKLRTIVKNLITALGSSHLINPTTTAG